MSFETFGAGVWVGGDLALKIYSAAHVSVPVGGVYVADIHACACLVSGDRPDWSSCLSCLTCQVKEPEERRAVAGGRAAGEARQQRQGGGEPDGQGAAGVPRVGGALGGGDSGGPAR